MKHIPTDRSSSKSKLVAYISTLNYETGNYAIKNHILIPESINPLGEKPKVFCRNWGCIIAKKKDQLA